MSRVQLLTISEYARHRGCDEKAVRRALADGRISRLGEQRQCIDPAVADVQWRQNTRARASSRHLAQTAAAAALGAGAAAAPAPGQHSAQGAPAGVGGQPITAADYGLYSALAKASEWRERELELARKAGTLIERERALRGVLTAWRVLRDQSSTLGRTLAPTLAAIDSEPAIRQAIDKAVADMQAAFSAKLTALAEVEAAQLAEQHQAAAQPLLPQRHQASAAEAGRADA